MVFYPHKMPSDTKTPPAPATAADIPPEQAPMNGFRVADPAVTAKDAADLEREAEERQEQEKEKKKAEK